MKITRNKLKFLIGMDIFVLFLFLIEHYIERIIDSSMLFYFVYFWILIPVFLFVSFLFVVYYKQKSVFILQALTCVIFVLMFHFKLPERFALFIEIPRIEKRIENLKQIGELQNAKEICGYQILPDSEYLVFDWDPGFLDSRVVLIYDGRDSIKDLDVEKDRLYVAGWYIKKIIVHQKSCFYLCLLWC